MLTIDGRTGGGQLLRTALSLAAVTDTAFELENIRADRPDPGLKPQHLTAIQAVAKLCGAEVSDAEADSEELAFEPGELRPTALTADIGTAGSIALLFDAVLPLSAKVESGFDFTATGGTDVKWSPTLGYFGRVKLPLLEPLGLACDVSVERTGFYPVGGGRATLQVGPSSLGPIRLDQRGSLEGVTVYSKASEGLGEQEVADRQAQRAVELLVERDLPVDGATVDYVDSPSDGSSLLIRAKYAHSLAGFDALGERGKPSETVAEEAIERFLAFDAGPRAVDVHMGDQLLVFLALAGGRLSAPRLSDHIQSNAALIDRFGFDLAIEGRPDGSVLVTA